MASTSEEVGDMKEAEGGEVVDVRKAGVSAFLAHLKCDKDELSVVRCFYELETIDVPDKLARIGVLPVHVYQVARTYMHAYVHAEFDEMCDASKIAAAQHYVQEMAMGRTGIAVTDMDEALPEDLQKQLRGALADFLNAKLRKLLILWKLLWETTTPSGAGDESRTQRVLDRIGPHLTELYETRIEGDRTFSFWVKYHWESDGRKQLAAKQAIALLMSVYDAIDYGVPIEVLLAGIGTDFLARFRRDGI